MLMSRRLCSATIRKMCLTLKPLCGVSIKSDVLPVLSPGDAGLPWLPRYSAWQSSLLC